MLLPTGTPRSPSDHPRCDPTHTKPASRRGGNRFLTKSEVFWWPSAKLNGGTRHTRTRALADASSPPPPSQEPKASLELQFVYGYNGQGETSANLHVTSEARHCSRPLLLPLFLVPAPPPSTRATGLNTSDVLCNLTQGNAVYYVAGVGIVYDRASHSQKFFLCGLPLLTSLGPLEQQIHSVQHSQRRDR